MIGCPSAKSRRSCAISVSVSGIGCLRVQGVVRDAVAVAVGVVCDLLQRRAQALRLGLGGLSTGERCITTGLERSSKPR
jgi:hypothetical protein